MRTKGREDHQIWPEPKPLQPILYTHPNTNKSDHSATAQKHPNLVESGGKTRGENKVRKSDENCVEKLKKQPNFYARECEVRSAMFPLCHTPIRPISVFRDQILFLIVDCMTDATIFFDNFIHIYLVFCIYFVYKMP